MIISRSTRFLFHLLVQAVELKFLLVSGTEGRVRSNPLGCALETLLQCFDHLSSALRGGHAAAGKGEPLQ